MFADSVTHKLDVPDEPGAWIEVRELGWADLSEARLTQAQNSFTSIAQMGVEFYEATMRAQSEAPSPDNADVDRTAEFDKATILRKAVVAWSDVSVTCNGKNIEKLTEKVSDWLFKAIIDIHFPTEEELGKVSDS